MTQDQIDAQRWRAFLSSGYLRHLGSAGLVKDEGELYAHMGMEIWTMFGKDEQDPRVIESNAFMQELLTKYADKMIKVLEERKNGT